ncbi:MAG: serine protease [Clostridia bacterium]|nr:serine protease [Clostridia bacterium]
MPYYCNSCGGEAKEAVRNGKKTLVCRFCGSEITPSTSLKQSSTSIQPASARAASTPSPKENYAAPLRTEELTVAAPLAAEAAPATTSPEQMTEFMSAYDQNALSGEELYDKVIPSVVEILVQSVNASAAASGFVVSSKGMVITNAHAVLDGNGKLFEKIYVRYNGQYHEAHPLAIGEPLKDQDHDTVDLCLLYVKELSGATAIDFADIQTLKNGQRVYLIGNSLGNGTCITSGIISDKDRRVGNLSYPYIMTDAAANPGNSGGPLVNVTGELIGVLVAGITSAKGMNYAIPVNILEQFLTYAIRNTRLKELDLGELNRFKDSGEPANYAVTFDTVMTGIKLLISIVEYIAGIFS